MPNNRTNMDLTQPKKLYLASNLGELNNKIDMGLDIKKTSLKLLIKSVEKLHNTAETAYKEKDEEKAYLFCMRYTDLIMNITKMQDYKNNKSYYDSILKFQTAKAYMNRANILQESLSARYDKFSANSKFKTEPKILESVDPIVKIEKIKTLPDKKSQEKKYFGCRELHTLINERSSSYLIVDVRPQEQFQQTKLKNSRIINIPECIVKQPGLTANKAGRELEEQSRALWEQRHTIDHLIICDENTDSNVELPHPIKNLIDSIESWDPGKNYRTKPVVLDGGFYMFRLMYPMLAFNPSYQPPKNKNDSSTSIINSNTNLNFEYPDLDEGFCATPSPQKTAEDSESSLFTPNVNRGLKPKPNSLNGIKQEQEDQTDILNNGLIISHESSYSIDPSISIKEEQFDNGSKKTSIKTEGGNALPSVPSRDLKPKELMESFKAKERHLDETENILDQTVINEKETLKVLEEIEKNQEAKETTFDEEERMRLARIEDSLQKDIKKLTAHSALLESKYSSMAEENKALWSLVKEVVANQMNQLSLDNKEPMMLKEESEQLNVARSIEVSMKEKEKEVEMLKKMRKEKTKAIATIAENEKRRKEEQLMKQRNLKNKELHNQEERKLSGHKSRIGGDTYTERLKTSPHSSPIRGGSKLKRSHSALNLSQLGSDEGSNFFTPSIDRKLKPLEAPRKRNLNAARQRNFEPKYGTVSPNRTGLKNLGNTCYMNSIVQCLSNTCELARYFFEGTYSDHINLKSTQKGDVAEEVAAVVCALWSGSYRSISLWDLKAVVSRSNRLFYGNDQHDSHEFLINLMDWLHNDLNLVTEKKGKIPEQNHANMSDSDAARSVLYMLRQRDDSVIRNLFYGLHRSIIVCTTCRNRSLTFEPFSVLTLPFPSNGRCTLYDMLQEYYKESQIEYKCEGCMKMRTCIRKIDIWKLPAVLVIHLNRFEQRDVLTKKMQNYVDFPIENLEMSGFTNVSSQKKYDLYGVSNHMGTMDGGHYTAFCRSPQSKSWWARFDDHEVYDLSRESVKSSAAYVLFYESVR